jgi:hypothetical protein
MLKNQKIYAVLAFLLSIMEMHSQIPRDVPHPNNNSPIDLQKPEDVIIFIILPIVFVILFFIGRKYQKKNN